MPQVQQSRLTLDTPLQYLRGVGEARAALLRSAGLDTVLDLLYFFPFRFEDRRHPITISELRRVDQPVTLRGRVMSAALRTSPVKRLKIFEVMFADETGTVMLVWFNQPYLADQIRRDDRLVIYGQPRVNNYGRFQIENPDFEKVDAAGEADDEGSIVPIYSSVNGIPPKIVRRLVQNALEALPQVVDPLSGSLREQLGVIDLQTAIVGLHHPDDLGEPFVAYRAPAQRRMIVDEFFRFQLSLRLRRARQEVHTKTHRVVVSDAVRERVRSILPFRLTGAQRRVLKEIAEDLQAPRPMYRLLQGDVGSGKTIVALITALVTIENRQQAALMAPTEILAEQHWQRISQLLDGSPVRLERLTGSTPAGERRKILRRLSAGEIDLLIGTHALIEPEVVFRSLGLAVVDEQHRFGVEQRQRLFEKGTTPDILVMTATPIPRSLALTLFGDLELSVIDELPPGRTMTKTVIRGTAQLERVYAFLDEELARGGQAFVIYPLIEESERVDYKALTSGFASLQQRFGSTRVAMLHGRMSADEKEKTMRRFAKGEIAVLVSTTVVEVGIDVPNASVMMIMDADRFGLSQLHQLRGRVGRGERKSYCILVRDETATEEAKARLRMFESTTDGFAVAERDLQLRGAGDILGTRQSGIPRFRFGDILRDHDLMEHARRVAIGIIDRQGAAAAEAILTAYGAASVPLSRD